MHLKKIAVGFAALALVAAPALAQMTPAVAPLSGDEAGASEETTLLLAVGAAALLVGTLVIASGDNDPDLPVSP